MDRQGFSTRYIERWWLIPARKLGRISALLSAAWNDGLYLAAWPRLALLLPMGAFLFGWWEGATHWSFHFAIWDSHLGSRQAVTFVQMLPFLFMVAILGALSAQAGLLVTAGFVIGDLFFWNSPFNTHIHSTLLSLIDTDIPRLISYFLLFMVAVQFTLASRVLARSLTGRGGSDKPDGGLGVVLLTAGIHALILYAWTKLAPMAVRPFWLWGERGAWPPLTVPYFTSVVDPWLPICAAASVVGRGYLSRLARDKLQASLAGKSVVGALSEAKSPVITRSLPRWAIALWRALWITLLLAGFIATFRLGLGLFIVIAAIFLALEFVSRPGSGLEAWITLRNRLPLFFRWAAVAASGFLIARLIYLSPHAAVAANRAAGAFGPQLIAIVAGLIPAAFLLAGGPPLSPRHAGGFRWRGPTPAPMLVAAAAGALFAFHSLPALAYCADSVCCFASNAEAILTVAAAVLIVATVLVLAPEILALFADALGFGEAADAVLLSEEVAEAETIGTAESAAETRAVIQEQAAESRVAGNLDEAYGDLREPARIKSWERGADGNIIENPTRQVLSPSSLPAPGNNYIWVVDEEGSVVFGQEIDGATLGGEAGPLGHPTLIGGRAGRIGGEIRWQGNGWDIIAKSGRYSTGFGRTAEQLNRVAETFRGLGVNIL